MRGCGEDGRQHVTSSEGGFCPKRVWGRVGWTKGWGKTSILPPAQASWAHTDMPWPCAESTGAQVWAGGRQRGQAQASLEQGGSGALSSAG